MTPSSPDGAPAPRRLSRAILITALIGAVITAVPSVLKLDLRSPEQRSTDLQREQAVISLHQALPQLIGGAAPARSTSEVIEVTMASNTVPCPPETSCEPSRVRETRSLISTQLPPGPAGSPLRLKGSGWKPVAGEERAIVWAQAQPWEERRGAPGVSPCAAHAAGTPVRTERHWVAEHRGDLERRPEEFWIRAWAYRLGSGGLCVDTELTHRWVFAIMYGDPYLPDGHMDQVPPREWTLWDLIR